MNPECRQRLESEIGRPLRESEINHIRDGLSYFLNEVNRDPANSAMTRTQRQYEAARRAYDQSVHKAEKAAQRSMSNALAKAEAHRMMYAEAQKIGGKQPFYDAAFNKMQQLDERITGARNYYLSMIRETIEAAESRFLGLFENPQSTHDLVFEMYGKDTGNQAAKKGAKALTNALDQMRIRANAAGADIGKLDYAYLPQLYSLSKVSKMGKESVVSLMFENVDRSRYLNVDGSRMGDDAIKRVLADAYETIVTDGLNKIEPGVGGGGSRASKFDSAHRSLHFNGPDGYLNVMNKLGKGSLFEALQGHISGMAKDIVLMEEMGANPNGTFRMMKDIATKENGAASNFSMGNGRRFGANLDMYWDVLTGSINTPENPRLAEFGQGVRSFFIGAKLGGATLSSLNDVSTLRATYNYHGMPSGKWLVNLLKNIGGDYRQNAARLGLYVDNITATMTKFHANDLTEGWTGKMANAVLKASMLEGWTHAVRRAMALGFSTHLADLTGRFEFGALDGHKKGYQNYLEKRGIDSQTWNIWKQAERVDFDGVQMLTPDAINRLDIPQNQKNKAIEKLMGLIARESEYASLGPDLATRAVIGGWSGKKGTVQGELGRSFFLFKSFTIGMLSKHIQRIQEIPTAGGKLAYSSSLAVSLTLLGALSVQLKDIVNGKDPREMDNPKFWAAAFVQGGGAGILGDIAYTGLGGENRGGQPNYASFAGPVFGTGFDILNATLGNIGKGAEGKETNFASSAIRLVRQNTPGVGIWYVKGAFDHAVTYELQEMANPGFANRMRKNAQKEFGQGYWWNPDETLPDRAPDLTKITSN